MRSRAGWPCCSLFVEDPPARGELETERETGRRPVADVWTDAGTVHLRVAARYGSTALPGMALAPAFLPRRGREGRYVQAPRNGGKTQENGRKLTHREHPTRCTPRECRVRASNRLRPTPLPRGEIASGAVLRLSTIHQRARVPRRESTVNRSHGTPQRGRRRRHMPAPASASPSRRRPTSTLGVSNSRPPPGVKSREPSSAVRTRVTPASEAFSRPAGPSNRSLAAPTPQRVGLERQREPARRPRADQLAPRPHRRHHHRHGGLERRPAVRRQAQRAGTVAGRPPYRHPVVDLVAHPR